MQKHLGDTTVDPASTISVCLVGFPVDESNLVKYPIASVAGNKYQLGIARGMQAAGAKVDCVSVRPTRMWDSPVWLPRVLGTVYPKIPTTFVSYINLPIIKQILIALGVLRAIITWAWNTRSEAKRVVLVYNSISYVAMPSFLVARLLGLSSALILADVPLPEKRRAAIDRLESNIELRLVELPDMLVTLTEPAADRFSGCKPCMVIEGGCETYSQEDRQPSSEVTPDVLFTGTLNSVSGIGVLVDAMDLIKNHDVHLHIYGGGSGLEPLRARVSRMRNVTVHDPVDNVAIMRIQRQSGLLASPRLPDDYITKYTFPSKLLEYLSSGIPTLSNQLAGIPQEYGEFINVAPSATADDWAKMIDSAFGGAAEEFLERAARGREFLRTHKTWELQGQRLVAFLIESQSAARERKRRD